MFYKISEATEESRVAVIEQSVDLAHRALMHDTTISVGRKRFLLTGVKPWWGGRAESTCAQSPVLP